MYSHQVTLVFCAVSCNKMLDSVLGFWKEEETDLDRTGHLDCIIACKVLRRVFLVVSIGR